MEDPGCPWPKPGTSCACSSYAGDITQAFGVYGRVGSDRSRKLFLAQQICVRLATKIRRFFIIARKLISGSPPENEGLIVGIVDVDTLNDPDKLFDTSKWWWWGYLPDLPEKDTWYYICGEPNKKFPENTPVFLLFATNADAFVWEVGGYGEAVFPLDAWTFSLNNPPVPDGWHKMDPDYDVCGVIYCDDGHAVIEPDTEIREPNFPPTATVDEPYRFSFIHYNKNAFPCGCPAALWTEVYNRDTNEKIGEGIYNLECGYMGIPVQGEMTFTKAGVFQGRIDVGHFVDGNKKRDDSYNFDVTITGAGKCNIRIQPESKFYEGPFNPGDVNVIVADLYVKNIGDRADKIHLKLCEYPNTPNENVIADMVLPTPLNPNEERKITVRAYEVPDKLGQDWPLGVKVWCEEDEIEPSWG